MDFVCKKEQLVFAVKLASYALGTRSNMPILSGIKMEIEGNSLRIYTTDLERAVRCELPIENKAEDETTVLNGAVLSQIATRLPQDERIALKTDESDGKNVKLQCGEAMFDLRTLPTEDYPQISPLPETKVGQLDVSLFHRGLDQTAFSALKAGETTRLSLTGVNLVLEDDSLKMVATNGYRLSLKKLPAKELLEEGEFLIDAGVLSDLVRILSQLGTDSVEIYRSQSQLFFQAEGVTFMAKIITDEFPDFDRVIPKDNNIALVFDRLPLLETLQRIEITAAEESGAVTIRANNEESAVSVHSSSKEKGEAEERVRLLKVPSEEIETHFKAEYLIDVLKRMKSSQIALWLSAPDKAGLIEPYGEDIDFGDEGFLYVCMPVRVATA